MHTFTLFHNTILYINKLYIVKPVLLRHNFDFKAGIFVLVHRRQTAKLYNTNDMSLRLVNAMPFLYKFPCNLYFR